MKSFFKITFASMLGTFLTLIVLFFLFMGIISSIASMAEKEEVTVHENSILHLKLDKQITEREPKSPLINLGIGDETTTLQGLDKILASIKAAKTDNNIKGISFEMDMFTQAGFASLQAIRNQLIDFKKSGKFVFSYSEVYTQKAYYLASVSDKIFLNPVGTIEFSGLNAEIMFFKNALDKFKVEVQIIRGPDNKFKSAVEPFMLEKMSEANREQMSKFLNSVWGNVVADIAVSRKMEINTLMTSADSLFSFDPKKALEIGMIDKLAYQDEYIAALMAQVQVKNQDDLNIVEISDYAETLKRSDYKEKNKIAVIYAVGEIQSGEGDDEIMGSERIAEAIYDARTDKNVKAIVLRVNSPGGSALASEVMWRELVLAKQTKPIIVSMGDYAASGGYYISCMADKIVAQPNTLTGSIGVFGMIPNFKGFLEQYIGITFDNVGTNANSNIASVFKPLTPFQQSVIQKEVVNIYYSFISHVAEGRKMKVEDVDKIGQGRIWSGTDAKQLGLVDELGGLDEAIALAAKTAKIDKYKVSYLPEQKDFFETFFNKVKGGKTSVDIKKELGSSYMYYEYLQRLQKLEGTQMRLPFFVNVN